MTSYDFIVKDNKGNMVNLNAYKGKVLLIVNTATNVKMKTRFINI